MKNAILALVVAGVLGIGILVGVTRGACGAGPLACGTEKGPALKMQSLCPVMGGKINKDIYVDVKGARIYACCAGCIPKIEAEPDKYLAKIKEAGEQARPAPLVLCGQCGEVKKSARCCIEGAKVCDGCGLSKGSPGCCRIEKGADVDLYSTADCRKACLKGPGSCGGKKCAKGAATSDVKKAVEKPEPAKD